MGLTLSLFLELHFTDELNFLEVRSDEIFGIALNQLAEDQIVINCIDEDGV